MNERQKPKTDRAAAANRETAEGASEVLLADTARLKSQITGLQDELRQLEEDARKTAGKWDEKQRLADQLITRLNSMENEYRSVVTRYVGLEQEAANLLSLYVAVLQLHATLDRGEVIAAVQEIVTNLVGSEEHAIFELDESRRTLGLIASFGVNGEKFRTVSVGAGIIGDVARTGEKYIKGRGVANPADGEDQLTACIPLKVEGRTTGALAVFRLLQQKSGLEHLDEELFDLLGNQAGMALFCTALYSTTRRG